MSNIKYAIKIKDKFIEFKWNYNMDWEDALKSDININTIDNILFDYKDEAVKKMNNLIYNLNKIGKLDDFIQDDIFEMNIVKLETFLKIKEI